jgi:hypothetical protein
MLVNNLDLKLTRNGSTSYPWKLDPEYPTLGATDNGQNDVDNVEQVYIEHPDSGEYILTVDHGGTLANGSQDFSLLVSGTEKSSIQQEGAGTSDGSPSARKIPNPTLHVFPNPALSRITLETETAVPSEVLFYNTMGQLVKKAMSADYQTQMEVGDLDPGLYVILVRTGGDYSYTKLYKK